MEITVFTHGDSADINTWSNVPYMFTASLERHGVKVNRVNIEISWLSKGYIGKLYNRIRYLIYKDGYFVTRTKLYRYLVNLLIKRASKQYPNTDYNLFLTISFTDLFSGKRNIHFFDWTYKISRERYGYWLTSEELDYCQYENDIINSAHAVFPMFNKTYDNIISSSTNHHIFHLKRNVVNNLGYFSFNGLMSWVREREHTILFIGRKAYIKGCLLLIEAFNRLRNDFKDLKLAIVGMTEDDFEGSLPDGVNCYGYLHKNIEKEKDIYYSLLRRCVLFCNPSSYWGGVF